MPGVEGPISLQELIEGFPVQELHQQVRLAAVEFARVERLGDVRVAYAARGGGLPQEPLDDSGLLGGIGVQDLERAVVLGDLVLDLVDDAHPPRAERAYQAQLAGDERSRRQRREFVVQGSGLSAREAQQQTA
jgi:hypothetical protein